MKRPFKRIKSKVCDKILEKKKKTLIIFSHQILKKCPILEIKIEAKKLNLRQVAKKRVLKNGSIKKEHFISKPSFDRST